MERDMRIKFNRGCCRTKIESKDGWLTLKHKSRPDNHAKFSDWQTQDEFFPERPEKYSGCPIEKMVKLKPSVKIVFNRAQTATERVSINTQINGCAPDLVLKWTGSGWRVDIIPNAAYTVPEAEALATKLKQCIADNPKIVVT